MLKVFLCVLVFGGYALASGGGPYPRYHKNITYDCGTDRSDIKVHMTAVSTDESFVPLQKVSINGLNGEINSV